jgi:hypothetical protein
VIEGRLLPLAAPTPGWWELLAPDLTAFTYDRRGRGTSRAGGQPYNVDPGAIAPALIGFFRRVGARSE